MSEEKSFVRRKSIYLALAVILVLGVILRVSGG